MSYETEFNDFMPQTVTLRKFSGLSTDGYGANAFSTTTYTLRARIEEDRRIVKDATGREVVSSIQVFTPLTDNSTASAPVSINVQDQIVLPSGFQVAGSSAPPIISVERHQDDTGDHHEETYL